MYALSLIFPLLELQSPWLLGGWCLLLVLLLLLGAFLNLLGLAGNWLMLGELWKGSDAERRFQVGRSAFWGRVLGTLAKTMVGTLMLLISLGGLLF